MNTTYCREFPDECYLDYVDVNPTAYDYGVMDGTRLIVGIAILIACFYCKKNKEKK